MLGWGEGVSGVMLREPVGIPPLPLEQHCLGTAMVALHFHLEGHPLPVQLARQGSEESREGLKLALPI